MRNCGVAESYSLWQDKILMDTAAFLWTVSRIHHESNEEYALDWKIQNRGTSSSKWRGTLCHFLKVYQLVHWYSKFKHMKTMML